ncbi:cytochrome P450 [Lentinula aciculospora]|uniref:Cytochrome P450 n=1 Tax=Lentinula aciculospora TaxID=153920 RepID=A0A9W9AN29_9AGAR|nr:cytochrome P450 [Lentinula aciculospora]
MAYAVVAPLVVLFLILYSRRKSRQYPLPPGPRKFPIVENLFQIPSGGFLWLDYAELCRKYESDIIHLSALGNSIIVLNSAKTASDLLEKRSSIYSSRPPTVMLGELMGWGSTLIFRPNDDSWKSQRRIINQALPPTDPKRFHPKQLSATHDLLRVLPHSDNLIRDFSRWAAAFIMDVTYGLDAAEAQPYLPTAVAALDSMATAGTPGAFYVDQIPILKYVPEWFPGADFKRKAREWSDLRVKMTETAFNVTKQRMAMGTATQSLTLAALEQIDRTQDLTSQEDIIKKASVTAYGGGSDTIVAALGSFILNMLMNPEIQIKAHEQLEKVLGPGDLPSFSDEPLLPYITAITQEALRHNPVTPLAFPHELTQDDIYEGYFLPKKSIIMPNVWSILHNEEDYPNAEVFNPSRFLDADGKMNSKVKDPANTAFGFGRRACPGKHIALGSLWIAVASILTCYSIEPELDEHGKPVKPKAEWYPGPTLFNHPLPFKCRFVPRSRDVEASLGVSLI